MADLFDDHVIGLGDPGLEVQAVPSNYQQVDPANVDYFDFEQVAGWIPRYIKVDADCTLRVDLLGHSDNARQEKVTIWCQKGYNAERVCRIYVGGSDAGIGIWGYR